MGKVVLKVREEEQLGSTPALQVPAISKTFCSATGVYLITGGLGGMGLEVVNFLVKRNARRQVTLRVLSMLTPVRSPNS